MIGQIISLYITLLRSYSPSMEIKAKNMKAVCSEPDACHGLRMAGEEPKLLKYVHFTT